MNPNALAELADLAVPKIRPPLDGDFRPAALAERAYEALVRDSLEGVRVKMHFERSKGAGSTLELRVLPSTHAKAHLNEPYIERLVKFVLWQKGAWKIHFAGPKALGESLSRAYSVGGARQFDVETVAGAMFERPFEVVQVGMDQVPETKESAMPVGRHLEGCRVGFDLGASDRKAAAVIDGEEKYTEEVMWDPRGHENPAYHYEQIREGIATAASHMPRLDAIGGSSAGVIIDNRVMIASLFRGVPKDRFDAEVKDIFLRIGEEFGVPLEVANDGDVTALAGAMSLDSNRVLGVAMGSSEAAGYVDAAGAITGWTNELAFAPIDYSPNAPADEWSKDIGCGVQYLTQQAVFRLASASGIQLDESLQLAERLKIVQTMLANGDRGALTIWETIGVYCGYAVAHYARHYDIQNMLILGRVTSGEGGDIILELAREVLAAEFPEIAGKIEVMLPDEKTRRVGQAVAAASLPKIALRSGDSL